MASLPPCRAMGPHCSALAVTLRIADMADDTPADRDALGTWLLGHTERISFQAPYVEGDQVLVDATIHVPCKYLRGGRGEAPAHCAAHGFTQRLASRRRSAPVRPWNADGEFTVMHGGRVRTFDLPRTPRPRRSLPTLEPANPCVGAPCRTADNTRGAACCRDLTVDVVLPDVHDPLEALLRSRRSPYFCKVTRASPEIVECEVISACGYLADDRISCVLHDRVRPDGRPAKPAVCSEWPSREPEAETHPGCRLAAAARPT